MSYIVLARKWRSRHFDEVVGQEHVARTLCNAIEQERVAHAFLFCGPRGVGKTSTARIMAKALNCAQGPTGRPCYACPSCEEISAGTSVDVFEIDGASNRGVNEIRELREGVRYAPNRDRHKIYIIDEVHMLTTEAFNALLKTLEEPPEHVKFIFATTEPQKIPVTILSRCQRFDFKRIPIRKIVAHLQSICEAEGFEAEDAALSMIARQADGCMRDALSLTDQVISFTAGRLRQAEVAEILGVASREVLFELSHALLTHDVEAALKTLDRVSMGGHDLVRFASALVGHLRDLTVVKLTGSAAEMTDLTDDELASARQQAEIAETSVLQRMFNLMVKAADDMSRSGFPKLIFEMALVKLAAIEPLMPIELLLKRLEVLESGALIGEDEPGFGGGGHSGGGPGAGAPGAGRPPGGMSASAPPSPAERDTPTRVSQAPRTLSFPQTPPAAEQGQSERRASDERSASGSLSDEPPKAPFKDNAPPIPESPFVELSSEPPPRHAARATPNSTTDSRGGALSPAPPTSAGPPAAAVPDLIRDVQLVKEASDNIVPFRPKPSEEESSPTITAHALERPPEAESQGGGDDASHAVAKPQESFVAPQGADFEQGAASERSPAGVHGVNSHVASSRDDAASAPQSPNGRLTASQALNVEPVSGAEVVDGTDWTTARRSWRRVVDHLRPNSNIVAAWLVQARLKRLEPGIIELDFEPEMSTFTDGERHQSIVAEAAHEALAELWGGSWSVHFNVMDVSTPETAQNKSLAAEDADMIAARKDRARELIAAHKLVTRAQAIFNPEKVQIILDDDEFYSRDLFH